MAMKVRPVRIGTATEQVIDLPAGSHILNFGVDRLHFPEQPFTLYVQLDDSQPIVSHRVCIVTDDEPLDHSDGRYVTSVYGNQKVWHLFDGGSVDVTDRHE